MTAQTEDARRVDPFATLTDPRLAALVDAVTRSMAGSGRIGVAFSAGVDSTLLLALAVRACGEDGVIALVAVSPSLARSELAEAHELADLLGVRCLEVETREFQVPAYRRNGPDRCYFCKDELFRRISEQAVERHHLEAIAYGETADDQARTDRPGARAAAEHSVLSPLADAGFTKLDVRAVAFALGLPNWNKPATPCLASRIPHFSEVIPEKVRQVERAEHGLRALGFPELRVRHHGDVARIELPLETLPHVAQGPLRQEFVDVVRAAGFTHVTVDLAGLRSGNLHLIAVNGADRHDH